MEIDPNTQIGAGPYIGAGMETRARFLRLGLQRRNSKFGA